MTAVPPSDMTAVPPSDAALRALVRELLTDLLRESGLSPARVGNSDTLSRGFPHRVGDFGAARRRPGTRQRAPRPDQRDIARGRHATGVACWPRQRGIS